MKMQFVIISTLMIFSFEAMSQDLSCADFKTGNFYIKKSRKNDKTKFIRDGKIEEFDLVLDPKKEKYLITRAGNSQTQWKDKEGKEIPEYHVIEWIDDCSYRLTYDVSKNKMDKDKKYVNDNNGIVFFKLEIKGRCMTYEGVMTMNDGSQQIQIGIICKE